MPKVPERLVNYRVYDSDSKELLGLSDVELPKFESLTETINGAGIAGDFESVVLGHFKSQALKLKWLVPTSEAVVLLTPVMHALDLRGSVQNQDPSSGALGTTPFRVAVRGMVKGLSLGKFEPGKRMDADIDVEIASISVFHEGVELIQFDKFNFVYKVLGVDYLRSVRLDMGGV